MSSRTKWRCSVCTYENWPAAIKCTLCRSPRSSPFTEEEVRHNLQHKDFSVSFESRAPHSSEFGPVLRCSSCTFLNKPSSFKCEQCFHVLQDPPESESSLSKIASASVVPSTLPLSSETGKWSCPQCTYENWPKSKFCVMCRSLPSPETLDVYAHNIEETSKKGFNISAASSSPLNSASPQPSRTKFPDHLWLRACQAVFENEIAPIERYLLGGGQIERRLTKKDCHHLGKLLQSNCAESQCNLSKSDRVISSGEESVCALSSVEALTSDESCHVGDITKLRAGWTLVDLAIRFGRTDLINLFIALNGLQNTSAAVSACSVSKAGARHSGTHTSDTVSMQANRLSIRKQSSKSASSQQQFIPRSPILFGRTSAARSKWMPCQASPQVARELRGSLSAGVKYAHGDFPCAFLNEWGTFALPHAIVKLPPPVRYLLLSEVCDSQAQTELEDDAKAINWWFVPGQKQVNRLFALWNRTAGDCLLDSVLQACWGVFDRENFLRRVLAESLRTCEASFYSRWRDYEALQAACHYILDETQCRRDWDNVLTAAGRPGGALEQVHIFALSHILRRPIIVYGVKYIKNYLDEPIGIANFQGIYIPLLWERNLCSRNPIVLGYTRGHFTALVPMEPLPTGTVLPEHQVSPTSRTPSSSSSRKHSPTPEDTSIASPSISQTDPSFLSVTETVLGSGTPHSTHPSFVYLPLVDRQGATLPIHFTTEKEANISHILLREWLDVVSSRRGLPLARLRLQARHILVERMLDEWLSSYRTLAKLSLCSINAAHNQDNEKSTSSGSSSSSSLSSANFPATASECERRSGSDKFDEQRSQSN